MLWVANGAWQASPIWTRVGGQHSHSSGVVAGTSGDGHCFHYGAAVKTGASKQYLYILGITYLAGLTDTPALARASITPAYADMGLLGCSS